MIAIPEALEQAITHIAQLEGQPPETWLMNLVADAIEQYHDTKIIERYEADRANGTLVVYSIEELKERMDKWDEMDN